MAEQPFCDCRPGTTESPGPGMPQVFRVDGVNVCRRCGKRSECQSDYAVGPTLGSGTRNTGWHAMDPEGYCVFCGEHVRDDASPQ